MTANSCGSDVFRIAYNITIVLGISQVASDIVTYLTPGRLAPELSIVLILKLEVIYSWDFPKKYCFLGRILV